MIELAVTILLEPGSVSGVCGLDLGGYARNFEDDARFNRFDIKWPEDIMHPAIVFDCAGGEAFGWLNSDGVIETIEVRGAGAPVGDGLSVGSTIDDLHAAYPETGRLICGHEEGGFVSFLTGRNEVFYFDVLPWLEHIDQQRCGEIPGETPTIGYSVYPADW